jgi:hypothetical protein
MYSEYLNDVTDEKYLKPIPQMVKKGSLPQEDLAIMERLTALKIRLIYWNSCSFFDYIFKTKEFKEKKS